MNHLNVLPYETNDPSDISELLALEQALPSALYDVPVSSQMASSYLLPAVQGTGSSAPIPGEGKVSDQKASNRTLPSIDVCFNLPSQTASTPGGASSSHDSVPCIHNSAPPTLSPPVKSILCYDLSSSDPFPDLYIPDPPIPVALGNTNITSSMTSKARDSSPGLDISNSTTPSVQIGYQMTSSQPFQTLCNMVNTVTSTSQAQCFHHLSSVQSSTDSNNVASPDSANINNLMSFEQPSPAPCNVAPSAPGSVNINNQMFFVQPPPAQCNVAQPAPGCSKINNQMVFVQPPPAQCNVAPSAPGSANINNQMFFVQPPPAPYAVEYQVPGCADINNQMSFSQPSPVLYVVAPLAPRSADANQLMSFTSPFTALQYVVPTAPIPGCDNSSHQRNASHLPPASNSFINFAKPTAPKRRCVRISKPALDILNIWFDAHIDHPYPDKGAVDILSSTCNITATQVKKWCTNRRRRRRRQLKTQIPTPTTTNDSKDSIDTESM